jgi:hypothetical protein
MAGRIPFDRTLNAGALVAESLDLSWFVPQ